jgi:uncharacterized protein YndB with AHSA1/START domain
MKIGFAVLAGLLALVAVVGLIGVMLPRDHRATSHIMLQTSPAEVWPAVRNLDALLGSWKDLESAGRVADQNGKEVWQQKAGGFEMKLIIEEATPPSYLVTRIDAPPDAAFGGTWTYQLTPEGTGTRVTITEAGYVSNPIFRVMMKAMGTHRSLDGFLTGLGAKFGQSVAPEHGN